MTTSIKKCMDCRGTPAESVINWDCLPVNIFGGLPAGALKAVTVGINPALDDWLGSDCKQWENQSERSAILLDYGRTSRDNLSENDCRDAEQRAGEYFWNPNKRFYPYFALMEMLLARIDHRWSYVLGTVAHVDLVACPTKMRFGQIPADSRMALLKNCEKHFLATLHELPNQTIILFNGKRPLSYAHKIGRVKPSKPQEKVCWDELNVVVGEIQTQNKEFIFCGWDQQASGLPIQFKIDLGHWIRTELEKMGVKFD